MKFNNPYNTNNYERQNPISNNNSPTIFSGICSRLVISGLNFRTITPTTMKTPRIEEYGEWDIEVDGIKYAGKRSLTQARHDWLREEIVRLEGIRSNIDDFDYDSDERGKREILQTIIDRYKAEIDQSTSQTPFLDMANRALEPKNAAHTPILDSIHFELDQDVTSNLEK